MAKVIVASSKTNKATKIENFNGTTRADLTSHPSVAPLLSSNVEMVISPGNLILRSDSSQLPSGDFNVYLIEKKNKSGISSFDIAQDVESTIDEELETVNDSLLERLSKSLVATIKNFFRSEDNQASVEDIEDEEIYQALAEARNFELDED